MANIRPNASRGSARGQPQFFTNALSTTSRGIDVVINYSPKIGPGILNLSYAANFNCMILGAVKTSGLLAGKEDTYFDLREQYFLRASAPNDKMNFTADYGVGRFNIVAHMVRFGQVTLANFNYDPDNLDVYTPQYVADLSVKYRILPSLSLTLGSQNMFNAYPSRFSPLLTESGGSWDPVQQGFNGRQFFARLNFKIPTKKS